VLIREEFRGWCSSNVSHGRVPDELRSRLREESLNSEGEVPGREIIGGTWRSLLEQLARAFS
jgi:hypothetical protein